MDFDRDAIVRIFLNEVEENLTLAEDITIELETRPEHDERLQALFRAVHTIKGGADSLGFEALTGLAHVVEDLLDDLRARSAKVSSSLVSLLLEAFDALRRSAERVRVSGTDSGSVSPVLLRRIEQARAARGEPEGAEGQRGARAERQSVPSATLVGLARRQTVRVEMEGLDAALDLSGEISVALGRVDALVAALPGDAPTELLDALARVEQLQRELQDRVVSLRMVPIGPLLRGFVRTVRDVSAQHGKQARLIVQDGDVTVDANVIEQLREPMTHLVRNAIDHGIELPERRSELGKDPLGRLVVRARRDAGAIVVEIEDDGAGLSRQRIAERARALGLLEGDAHDDAELCALIFAPGFSTAERVTDLSGRGVGLDAVKRSIEALRGTVDVRSTEGAGATLTLRLPVSLALLDGFAVAVESDVFVLPREAVRECFAFSAADPRSVGVLELRGQSLPFVGLHALLGHGARAVHKPKNVVVLECGGTELGLVVDEVLGDRKVVVKPLGPVFRAARAVSGCAVSGDGSMALVLDVAGLFLAAVRRRAARPVAPSVSLQ